MGQSVEALVECVSYMHCIVKEGSDVGDPFGLIPGPSGVPFGAVPVSPLGDTPGPRGTPFGAVDDVSCNWNEVSSCQSVQCRSPSIMPVKGQGLGVGAAVALQLGTVILLSWRTKVGSSSGKWRRTKPKERIWQAKSLLL